MDQEWLAAELEAGRSIEAIARDVGKDSSTVGYWVKKHGLVSAHAERHAPRGGIERETLERLVADGLSVRAIADQLDLSFATVRHWLKRYGLKTERARTPRSPEAREIERTCRTHGPTVFLRHGPTDHFRCVACRKERVVARRRTVKAILIAEAGGHCVLCGYARHPRALHFHHVEPSVKSFGIAFAGVTRSLERCREEAAKCVLLCSNCHAEVEDGLATIPGAPAAPSPG